MADYPKLLWSINKAVSIPLPPLTKRKDYAMLRQMIDNLKKTQRTYIEDISPLGELLSEEHLRGVSGGRIKKSHYPSENGKTDEDQTTPQYDTL